MTRSSDARLGRGLSVRIDEIVGCVRMNEIGCLIFALSIFEEKSRDVADPMAFQVLQPATRSCGNAFPCSHTGHGTRGG